MEAFSSYSVVLFIDQQQHTNNPQEAQPKSPIVGNDHQVPFHAPSKIQTLRRLSFSKPKARFLEFNPPTNQKNIIDNIELDSLNSTETCLSSDSTEDDEDEEEFEEDEVEMEDPMFQRKRKKIHWRLVVEWMLFIVILTCLVCSLTIPSLKNKLQWGIEVWRWCLMVMVLFSGRLVSGWIMAFLVFLIERNFMLRERVLYFVYGLRKSFQNCVWLGLVLLAWAFMVMFDEKVHKENKILKKVFKALVAVLLGATIWLVKIVLVKVLASSFHVTTYFDRMKESVFHHYILDTLSGPPMDKEAYEAAHHHRNLGASKSLPATMKVSKKLLNYESRRVGSRRIDIEELNRLSMHRTVSAWSVKTLVNYVRSFGLSTISSTVDEFGRTEYEITSEWEDRNCAKRIFKNVAKPGAKYALSTL